jgi:putative hemin transport protein
MGIREAEVVAAQVGHYVTRLLPDWDGIFRLLPRLGVIRAVTASRGAEVDAEGEFPSRKERPGYSVYSKEAIDLRVAIGHWRSAFLLAVPDARTGKRRRSIEFYGSDGNAMHKVFLTGESSVDAFEDIAEAFASPSQSQLAAVMEPASPRGLRAESKHGRRVAPEALGKFLEMLQRSRVAVNGFLGNLGCAQAYRGAIRKLAELDGLIRISEAQRELRLRVADIAEAWVVEKHAPEGIRQSLELFDAQGGEAATLLALGQDASWREALDAIPAWRAV